MTRVTLTKVFENFALSCRRNDAVARKRGKNAFMSEVLRPRLERFGVKPEVVSKLHKRVPKRMWIEIVQARERTSLLEDRANRVRVRLTLTVEPNCAEGEIIAGRNLGFRKDRLLRTEALFLAKEGDPIDDDLADIVPKWEEPGRECLRALGSDLPCVPFAPFVLDIDIGHRPPNFILRVDPCRCRPSHLR